MLAGLRPDTLAAAVAEGIGIAVLCAGYGSTAVFISAGMRRRRLSGVWRVLPLVPVYWLILSLAAWRALWQLVRDPYRWEKTSHGHARTTRRGLAGVLESVAAVPQRP